MSTARFTLSGIISCVIALSAAAHGPSGYVNTLVGTDSRIELSTGNTYPAIALPWGMNFWTPQTGKMGNGWAYTYAAPKIRGFKQTHQPSPWINDYGQFSLMPVSGTPHFNEDARASWFSHKTEEARPYYYKVYLADHDIWTEITPTERAAMMRFTYAPTDSAYIIVDAFDRGSAVRVIPERNAVVGYTTRNSGGVPKNFRNYFVMIFSEPIKSLSVVCDSVEKPGLKEAEGRHAGAIIGFDRSKGGTVTAKIASSFISEQQAWRNLEELGERSFEQVKKDGEKRWDEVLGRIEVAATEDLDNLRTFYSCLYRSTLFPRSFYEFDAQGNPVHYSPHTGEVVAGYYYTDTGFWDTFRSLFPLVNLLYPEEAAKMQEGLVNCYNESGFLPEWASPGHRGCMVGNNSASVVADAYIKGIRGYDVEKLWEAVKHGAANVHPRIKSTGRLGHEFYDELGYVPCDADINESAARTLEYAYDDWCIYQLGKALGKPEKELLPYARKAMNYRNLFNKDYNLMSGRTKSGSFEKDFNPFKWGGVFTEGNSWHYSWSVFQDPAGLIGLMGGDARFNAMLDTVFTLPPIFDDSYYGGTIHEIREMQIMGMGNYAHGNQPIQHMIYLYGYSNEPWKAQKHVREVMKRLYTAAPDGYCGDEDNGQTSAWYVFSALGFYPVCPATDQYVLGSPLFRQATIHLPSGDIRISAPANSDKNIFVNKLTLNGKDIDRNYLTHSELLSGGTLDFDMKDTPSLSRATGASARPYSFSTDASNPLKGAKGKTKKTRKR